MGWRKIESKDIKRGTCLRLNMCEDSFFDSAVIIKILDNEIYVARPFAYAHEHFDSNSPLLGSEVFSYSVGRILESRVEVYEGRDGQVRTMLT